MTIGADAGDRVEVTRAAHPEDPYRVAWHIRLDGEYLGTFGTLPAAASAVWARTRLSLPLGEKAVLAHLRAVTGGDGPAR